MKHRSQVVDKDLAVRICIISVLSLFILVYGVLQWISTKSLSFISVKNLFSGSGILNLLVTQFSLTFIVSSIITMLSSKDEKLLWCNLIEKNLVEPIGFSLQDFVYYLFSVLILGCVSIVFGNNLLFLFYFVICIICLIAVSVKMLHVYFGKDKIIQKLKREFISAEGTRQKMLSDLFDNTSAAIDSGNSAEINTNISFLTEIMQSSSPCRRDAADTFVGIFQVMAEKDIVLFHRVYQPIKNDINLDGEYTAVFDSIISAVYEKAFARKMSYIYKNMPRVNNLDGIMAMPQSVRQDIIADELNQANEAMEKLFERLTSSVKANPNVFRTLKFNGLEGLTPLPYNHDTCENIISAVNKLLASAEKNEFTDFLSGLLSPVFKIGARIQRMTVNVFAGEATVENHSDFAANYKVFADCYTENLSTYQRFGTDLFKVISVKSKNSEELKAIALFFWIVNCSLYANGFLQVKNAAFDSKMTGYSRLNRLNKTSSSNGSVIRSNIDMRLPSIPGVYSTSFDYIERMIANGENLYGHP